MESIHQDDPLQPLEEREISPEEREQVLKQLETAIVESRTPQRADLALLQAEKRGLLFPLLINLAALVLVGAGVFLLSRHFELRKENITLHRSSYISAEGTLIQTLKQETESRLQAKEEEIASIQRQLQRVRGNYRDHLAGSGAAGLDTATGGGSGDEGGAAAPAARGRSGSGTGSVGGLGNL